MPCTTKHILLILGKYLLLLHLLQLDNTRLLRPLLRDVQSSRKKISADNFFLFWDLEQDLTMRHPEGLQGICRHLLLKRQIENMCWRCFITLKNCVSIASWQSRASVIQESSNSRNPCTTHTEYYCLLSTFDNKFTAQNTKPLRIHAEKIYTVMLSNQTESKRKSKKYNMKSNSNTYITEYHAIESPK